MIEFYLFKWLTLLVTLLYGATIYCKRGETKMWEILIFGISGATFATLQGWLQ